jgi:ankyrin repeat protein
LMWATVFGDRDTVSLLLSRGADVDAKARDGMTALNYAKLDGRKDIIDLLRTYGSRE